MALAERAMAALPLEKDAMSGSGPIEILARVAAQTGETDRAIAALQKLLSIPAITDTSAPFTPALLRLDPMFDPLRKVGGRRIANWKLFSRNNQKTFS